MDNMFIQISGNKTISDESQFIGIETTVSKPQNTNDVRDIIRYCFEHNEPITVYGALTGLSGAGVPLYGHGLCTEKLDTIEYDSENLTIRVGAGVTFGNIEKFLFRESGAQRFFPVSPTEKSATIAGGIAMNASGPRCRKYGELKEYVLEITICDGTGTVHVLKPGERLFSELFGSEGMNAVITEVVLKTVPVPPVNWGLAFFFSCEQSAADFADSITGIGEISVLDFIDGACLTLLDEMRPEIQILKNMPQFPSNASAVVVAEIETDNESRVFDIAENLMEVCSGHGGDMDNIWSVTGDEVEMLRSLRHAVTECLNTNTAVALAADQRIMKISVSVMLQSDRRYNIINLIREASTSSCAKPLIYGSIGNNSLCVAFSPKSFSEYTAGKQALADICKAVAVAGGSIFRTLGIGKLYREIYCSVASYDELGKRLRLKKRTDPKGILNPENMFTIIKTSEGVIHG